MTDKPSDEIVERMVAFVRDIAENGMTYDPLTCLEPWTSQARVIAAQLPEPPDPDIAETAEITRQYIIGKCGVQDAVLLAIKRGRALAEAGK